MDQFVVPQFIDVEDKIFGPITVRQFVILLFSGVILFGLFRILELYTFAISAFVIGGGALIFAFVKVRGQTFHYFILNVVQSFKKPSKRIWKKELTKQELRELVAMKQEDIIETIKKKPAGREHIRQLSLMVNTGGYYQADFSAESDGVDDLHIG